jgi:hypothetical protein
MLNRRKIYWYISCLVLIASLVAIEVDWRLLSTADVLPDPRLPVANEQPQGALGKAGDSIVVNISGLMTHFEQLPAEQRAEQIADWAVLGTLAASDSDAVTPVTWPDWVPVRLQRLDEELQHGRGRYVRPNSSEAWLFYSELDRKRDETLASLMERLQNDTEQPPETVRLHRVRPDLGRGAVHVFLDEASSIDAASLTSYGDWKLDESAQRERRPPRATLLLAVSDGHGIAAGFGSFLRKAARAAADAAPSKVTRAVDDGPTPRLRDAHARTGKPFPESNRVHSKAAWAASPDGIGVAFFTPDETPLAAVRTLQYVTKDGELGHLGVRQQPDGVALDWEDGLLAVHARDMENLERLASVQALQAEQIASQKAFLPENDVFVLETATGLKVIRLDRTRPAEHPGLPDSNAAPRAYVLDVSSQTQQVASSIIDEANAMARINACAFQRLRHTDDIVARVFMERMVDERGTRVELELEGSTLGTVDGVVIDDALYLRRSASSDTHAAFNELLMTHQLDGDFISSVLARAQGDQLPARVFVLRNQLDPDSISRALQGDYGKALDDLYRSAQFAELDRAIAELERKMRARSGAFSNGSAPVPGALRYAWRGGQTEPWEQVVTSILQDLHDRKLSEVKARLTAFAEDSKVSAVELRATARALRTEGHHAPADYLDAWSHLASSGIPAAVELELSQFRLRQKLTLHRPKLSPPLHRAEVARMVEDMRRDGGVVYIQDSAYANNLPWDEWPGETLHSVATEPNLRWHVLENMPSHQLRPDDIVLNGTVFRGRRVPSKSVVTYLSEHKTEVIIVVVVTYTAYELTLGGG